MSTCGAQDGVLELFVCSMFQYFSRISDDISGDTRWEGLVSAAEGIFAQGREHGLSGGGFGIFLLTEFCLLVQYFVNMSLPRPLLKVFKSADITFFHSSQGLLNHTRNMCK